MKLQLHYTLREQRRHEIINITLAQLAQVNDVILKWNISKANPKTVVNIN